MSWSNDKELLSSWNSPKKKKKKKKEKKRKRKRKMVGIIVWLSRLTSKADYLKVDNGLTEWVMGLTFCRLVGVRLS